MENMYRVAIAHSPLKAFFNHIPALQDTFLGKGTVTFFGLKNGAVGEELCFEKPVEERVIVVQQPLDLFSKHGFVEFLKLFETHTSKVFWLTKSTPLGPVNFPLIPPLPPPEFPNQGLNLLAKGS